uniref:Uncharacterized protein n=1 Tax=Thermogemmatispora argillosa TaxID=2045280 RepID=A0A455T0W0_9CHLR|nr:hypothetical protein KTA_02540 [Thermogemmatispora argillosa]
MQWIRALVHRTVTHPERSLRRLERQIAAYQARQAHLEAAIQQLCAQHLAVQLQLRRQQRQHSRPQAPRTEAPGPIPLLSPGGSHAPIS